MPKFDVNKEVTTKLRFKPVEKLNNLCIGKLISVEFVTNKAEKEDSTWEYNHFDIPTVLFNFVQRKEDKGDADRYFTFSERIIGAIKKDGSPISAENLSGIYGSMWNRILHIYQAYQFAPNWKQLKSVPEIDEGGTAEERIAQFTKFFAAIAKMFNEGADGKPIYLNANGDPYPMTMKLLADYTTRKYLTFPTYVGQGFIEQTRMKDGKLDTVLEIKYNESIELGKPKRGVDADSAMPNMDVSSLPPGVAEMLDS